MKKIYVILALLAFSSSAFSQKFFINEDFSTGSGVTPPTGWTNITIAGDANLDKWNFSDSIYNFASPMKRNWAIVDVYNGGSAGGSASNNRTENVALVTPQFNTTGAKNLFLQFDEQLFINNYGTAYAEVSTDSSRWTNVWSKTRFLVEPTPNTIIVDLKNYKDKAKVWVRFRWQTTFTFNYLGYFALDNVKVYEKYATDVTIDNVIQMYDDACPSKKMPLELVVKNAGTITQSVIPVVVQVGGSTYKDTLRTSLRSDATAVLVMKDSFDASAGGNVTISAITDLSTDVNSANDTTTVVRKSSPPAKIPTPINGERCGVGSVEISATRGVGDSTLWYDAATGGNFVGEGIPFNTPVIQKTTDFYVANARLNYNMISSNLGLYRFNFSNTGPGSMVNVVAKQDIIIDSLTQNFAYAANQIVKLYMKTGTFNGSQTVPGDWTEVDLVNDTLPTLGYGDLKSLVPVKPITLPAGTAVAFYIDGDKSSVTFTLGNLDVENSDIRIYGNAVLSNDFANLLSNYYWNGEIHFRKTCTTNRVAVKATVLKLAEGAEMKKGSVFEGTYARGSAGDPDITAQDSTISYELEPPTGYTNADFGTKWLVSAFTMTTLNGTDIPAGDTTASGPGTSNGKVTYTPSSGWADSTIVMNVFIRRLDNNCDTLIQRHIFVAPTPHAEFEGQNVCLGTPISFNNTSSLSSGFMNYFWDFGDGNTSTFSDPIHNYTNYGKYKVKLTVTSDLGITKDTTVDIEVFEIPDVQFRVIHACEDVQLEFINSTTISSGSIAFAWDFGDGNTSNATNPKHLYATPGGYQVKLRALANGCANELVKNANQFPRPTASFSVTGECTGAPVTIVNESTIELNEPIGSYWQFGNGEVGTISNPKPVYNTAGQKTIKLRALSQFGCEDSTSRTITIKEGPMADFSFDKACNIDPVNFTNNSTEPAGAKTIYTWDFGDGNNSTEKSPSHNYTRLGDKIVILTAVSDNECSNETSQVVTVLVQPVAGFTISDVCGGEDAIFVNTTEAAGNTTFKWFFGDGDSSELSSPLHVYNITQSQTFNVRLLASVQGGCTDEFASTINVKEQPSCGFSATQSSADRTEWTFTPDNTTYGPEAYTWVLRGSKTYNEISPTHNFEYSESDYNIILRVLTPAGCECIDSSNVISTSWALGIGELSELGIDVYPNPSSGKVFIQSDRAHSGVFTLNVIDMSGKMVYGNNKLQLNGENQKLDLSHLANGVYQIRLMNDDIQAVHRLVIQR